MEFCYCPWETVKRKIVFFLFLSYMRDKKLVFACKVTHDRSRFL